MSIGLREYFTSNILVELNNFKRSFLRPFVQDNILYIGLLISLIPIYMIYTLLTESEDERNEDDKNDVPLIYQGKIFLFKEKDKDLKNDNKVE